MIVTLVAWAILILMFLAGWCMSWAFNRSAIVRRIRMDGFMEIKKGVFLMERKPWERERTNHEDYL